MLMPLHATLVQRHAPLSALGRVNSVMNFGNNVAGVTPLLCAPLLSRVLGVQGTLLAASVFVFAMPLLIGVTRRAEVSALVAQEEDETGR